MWVNAFVHAPDGEQDPVQSRSRTSGGLPNRGLR